MLLERLKRVALATGLALAFLLACLMGLEVSRAADLGQSFYYVGINGDPCEYSDVSGALVYANDGDTIYVSDVNSGTHHGIIGSIDHDLTFVAATNDCQAESTTEAYLDGDGGSWAPSGGLVVIDSNRTVTFTNIRLQNAHADLRGGIVHVESDGTLVLDGSRVMSGAAGYEGGGVNLNAGATLVMANGSIVYRNEVTQTLGVGGGVSAYSATILMEQSRIGEAGTGDGNVSSADGGGVYLENASILYMNDAHVLNNIAVAEGGGVWADGDSSIFVYGDSTIGGYTQPSWGNNATDGGGVFLDDDSDLFMYDTSRLGFNSSVDYGGGVYASSGARVEMYSDTRIYSNTAAFGGGAYLTGTNTTLTVNPGSARIEGNEAVAAVPGGVANGGGVLVTGEAEMYAWEAQFVDNEADLLGGGIFVAQDGAASSTTVVLGAGSAVSGNVAAYGGGLYIAQDGSVVVVDDSQIRSNAVLTAGGGIRLTGDSTLLLANNSVISDNVTYDGDGAGLAMDDGAVSIFDSLFQANRAGVVHLGGSTGGAIHQDGGLLTVTNSSFVGNSAYSGGGLSASFASTVLTNVHMISNYGEYGGGAIAVTYSDLEMGASFGPDCSPSALPAHTYCSEIRGNTSPGDGAGVYVGVSQSRVDIADTAFLDNEGLSTGVADGAALYAQDGIVSATNCLFSGNGANSNSAVYVGADAGYFSDNSTYAGNQDVPLAVDSQGAVTLTLNIIWSNGLPSDIQGSLSSRCNDTQTTLGGSGDISTDPQFMNLRGPYRLGPGSPAIDTCIGFTSHDLDGKPRPINAIGGVSLFEHDMGAFEARPPVFVPMVVRNYQ